MPSITLDLGPIHPSRKAIKKGIEFTIMVVGESGLGKSTLINTLFNISALSHNDYRPTKTVEISPTTLEIEERTTKIRVTLIDTPGFGDALNSDHAVKPLSDYIDQQLAQYYQDETSLHRRNIVDTRVHCVLYFIEPMGRGLKPLDIEFMRAVHEKVNLVPLLAKGDSYTNDELMRMKRCVIDDLHTHRIKIYEFPECDEDDEPSFVKINNQLKKLVPFSVVGSVDVVEVAGKTMRGRSYPWGFVNVDDETHCDFTALRTMLLRTHIHDLREITEEVHYENYRAMLMTRDSVSSSVQMSNTEHAQQFLHENETSSKLPSTCGDSQDTKLTTRVSNINISMEI